MKKRFSDQLLTAIPREVEEGFLPGNSASSPTFYTCSPKSSGQFITCRNRGNYLEQKIHIINSGLNGSYER